MTSHHDVAGVVAKLRYLSSPDAERMSDFERLNSFCHEGHNAADLLEAQAKALSEAEAENARLASALKGLSDMYASTWDRVDGALMMMDDGVKRFERAHGVAYKLLEARKLKPRANAAKEKT